jgi:hypothetical protein
VLRILAFFCALSSAHAFAATSGPTIGRCTAALGLKTGNGAGVVAQSRLRRSPAKGAGAGLRMQSQEGEQPDGLDRFVACLPYALPLADSFEWGHYVFDAFPLLTIPFIPLFPVIQFLNLPFVSFGIFILLFNFVARNPSFSRLVRFNTLQVRDTF